MTISSANHSSQAVWDELTEQHNWAATGVSDYPSKDPLVGQSKFFNRYRTFIKTIDHEDDKFAHVFAVEGEWGRGKSRLGYELIAQINDCSKGWYVRNGSGELENAELFDDESKRDEYLGLYIRYSQIVSKFQNTDNWFAYGLYQALIPLATKQFDGSIQSSIAKQALQRIEPFGFEASELANRLMLDHAFSDEVLYYDQAQDESGNTITVTQLVDSAYQYLQQFGIQYILIVLDELETVAEAATYGIDRDDACQLDGEAIRLIGKAIKEEDPRRKLPWLRYVALCSPLLGQQLREIQSTARRFELVELENNAFADVSDYVAKLQEGNKLRHQYPLGLVEAAYAMSGANFGWFNVVMANIDVELDKYAGNGTAFSNVGELFDQVLQNSGRISDHVLDHNAINGIQTEDKALLKQARNLLFAQLPKALDAEHQHLLALLPLKNEYDEPIVSLYRKVDWSMLDCRQALQDGKFRRDRDEWFYPSVDQGLNLQALRQNLRTFAINETGDENTFLLPLDVQEFRHLISLLYSHPAAEFAADALWKRFFGDVQQLEDEDKTHIGPSVAMLLRLDMRYRSQQQNSMIFREVGYADGHEKAMSVLKAEWERSPLVRRRTRLLGLFRLLDRDWNYNQEAFVTKQDLAIQFTKAGGGRGASSGLQYCEGLKLHPQGKAAFAWVDSKDELTRLNEEITGQYAAIGRVPVVAFTGSIGVMDDYAKGSVKDDLKENILLYYLNTSEIDVIERIGVDQRLQEGFELNEQVFTSKFKNRLNNIRDYTYSRIHEWRQWLNDRGLIAWPLKPSGRINDDDRNKLFKAWHLLLVQDNNVNSLNDILPEHGVDAADIRAVFSRLSLNGKVLQSGYQSNEHAGLFSDIEHPAQAQARVPAFLAEIANPKKAKSWTLDDAQEKWYWGYLWSPASQGLSSKAVFSDWMWLCSQLNLAKIEDRQARKEKWLPVTRSEIEEGELGYAVAWFKGKGVDSYQGRVEALREVFGEDKIPGLFAGMQGKHGTETTKAHNHLEAAAELVVQISDKETNLESELSAVVDAFPEMLRLRYQVLNHIRAVRDIRETSTDLRLEQRIRLEDDSRSLYSRIEQAYQFAQFVQTAAQRIEVACDNVISKISGEPAAQAPFPSKLFTLSLGTISNILQGAIKQSQVTETQRIEYQGSTETLNFYLRTLQLDKVSSRLDDLAREVGVDIRSGSHRSFEDISGYIVQAYRSLLKMFADTKADFGKLDNKLSDLKFQLGDMLPVDYPEADHPKKILMYQESLRDIEDALQDLDEEVDLFREKFATDARTGQFSAIKDVPVKLMKPITAQLGVLMGKVNSVESAVKSYRNGLIEKANRTLRPEVTPLLIALGNPALSTIKDEEVANLSLPELAIELECRQRAWHKLAEQALQGTSISVERWVEISSLMLSNSEPNLTSQEQSELVDKGIIKLQITFGGA
ncbi:hypothetical protein [Vibrio diazotrophicus]|uniref:hypothetical protein n=1 Tax=Vibrio diazotrophicus TaxID=685 RepID=UPI00142D8C47|nr:hypothetical protein [Vibrio diazotrophicus]NIY94381.1 hypothetical protein [Vibrio diazotrophicus]